MAYLINCKSPGHKLYPSDPAERAQVDRILYFDAGSLAPAQRAALSGLFRGHAIDPQAVKTYEEKLSILNSMLEGKKYLAGHDHRTIADLSILATVSANEIFPQVQLSNYPNIDSWYKNIRAELPYDKEVNQAGIDKLKAFVASLAGRK